MWYDGSRCDLHVLEKHVVGSRAAHPHAAHAYVSVATSFIYDEAGLAVLRIIR